MVSWSWEMFHSHFCDICARHSRQKVDFNHSQDSFECWYCFRGCKVFIITWNLPWENHLPWQRPAQVHTSQGTGFIQECTGDNRCKQSLFYVTFNLIVISIFIHCKNLWVFFTESDHTSGLAVLTWSLMFHTKDSGFNPGAVNTMASSFGGEDGLNV